MGDLLMRKCGFLERFQLNYLHGYGCGFAVLLHLRALTLSPILLT